jgi:glycosyltransferase involved in cell wall biosynthesis/GT2 family glycosyltransferase
MKFDVRPIPRISIVINTNGRVDGLRHTLESLRHLDYPNFEVCVVYGPTLDGTRELVASFGEALKSADCPELNLSRSRNIGIACAAGDIIAFIDDDAVAEPEWLTQLVAPFDDEIVAASGGFVYDHTGYTYQYRFAGCDRLGNPRFNTDKTFADYNYPFSTLFPYVQGTNCAFRRKILVEVGGFDEEYEFYLDETDLCCRLNDHGKRIAQLKSAFVHHKYLASHIRKRNRVTVDRYAIVKNKIYFSMINSLSHHSYAEICSDALRFTTDQRSELQEHFDAGRIAYCVLANFDADADRAWEAGLKRGLSGQRRIRPVSYFADPPPFRQFPILRAEGGRKSFVFLSDMYPPATMGGVARYTHDIARTIGALGHTVHVLTTGEDFSRVDFEEGVWVHRIVPQSFPAQNLPDGTPIPQHILNYSATQLSEIDRIAKHREITAVEGSSWNCECLAAIMDGRYPCIVNVVTSLSNWLDTHPEYREDPAWMRDFGHPMLAAETYLITHSAGIIAASRAIVDSVEERYGVDLSNDRICFIPHGIADTASLPRSWPDKLSGRHSDHRLGILFVGRLELRKGIDIMLDAAATLLATHPDIEFWIAGDDSLALEDGRTAKERFVAATDDPKIKERIVFLGQVSEEELRWLYAECDMVVMPSRFESFGLIVIEAMMFAKPAIGCKSSGSEEVIADGQDGILTSPGNVDELVAAIGRLIHDPAFRHAMGKAGRTKFEERFVVNAVAAGRIAFLSRFARQEIDLSATVTHGKTATLALPQDRQGLLLELQSVLTLDVDFAKLYITFFQHSWSGIVEIGMDNASAQEIDLYAEGGVFRTVEIDTSLATYIRISRPGRARQEALGTEVIIAMIQTSIR